MQDGSARRSPLIAFADMNSRLRTPTCGQMARVEGAGPVFDPVHGNTLRGRRLNVANKRTGRMPAAYPGIVAERSGGMCERCLVVPASEIHHRRYLSRGGKHNLANLLHLCGTGNFGGCHGEAHTGTGGEVGTSISRHNPNHEAVIPFTDLLGREWWLDDTGLRHDRQPQPY